MKWLLYLTILGIFVFGINGHRLVRQTSENELESEVEMSEPTEVPELQESEPTEPAEMEEPAEVEEPSEMEEPAEIGEPSESHMPEQSESVPGAAVSSVINPNAVPGEQAAVQSSVVIADENSSEEENTRGAAIANQNAAGGDSSQEVDGMNTVAGGAGLGGGIPMDSEEETNAIATAPIPTQLIQSTPVYMTTGSPLREATTTEKFDNRGDAFFGFGPQEGSKNRLGSEPKDSESSTSPQKIGLIVGATTAGTVAVVAGAAIAYVKLKGVGSAGAA